MAATEIVVILFGLFAGYWLVSNVFMGSAKKPEKSTGGDQDRARESSSANNEFRVPWHQVLNVPVDAPIDEIRRSYRTLISQYHPDKVATLGDELKALAEHKSAEINRAYQQAIHERGCEV